jgi:hypothetical protein
MRRALALPVSAAVTGALLAIGVSLLGRSFESSHDQIHVVVERAELAEVQVDLAEVERQVAEAIARMGEIQIDNPGNGTLPSTVTLSESEGTVVIVHPSERMLELRARVEEELERPSGN